MLFKLILTTGFLFQCYCKKSVRISIDTQKPIQTINPLSPSVALGISIFKYKWVYYFKNQKFLTLATSLGPSFLRVGGTRADYVTFQPDETDRYWRENEKDFESKCCVSNQRELYKDLRQREQMKAITAAQCQIEVASESEFSRHRIWAEKQQSLDKEAKRLYGFETFTKPINLTGEEWRKLNEVCECVGWKLIYGLNILKRNGSKWDSRNAQELIDFTKNRFRVNWELGNEPNSYRHKSSFNLTPEQIANGFVKLRKILNQSSWWNQSMIIGPDINRIQVAATDVYLKRFLAVAGSVVDAITFHQYYFNGKKANQSDYLNPAILNSIIKQIIALKKTINASSSTQKLWLGETSSGYGGGAPGFSNTFIDGFTWLDKLGITSSLGVDLVIRQTFFGDSYALIDNDFNPRPDYWLTLLYKRLFGNRVLNVSMQKCVTKTLCKSSSQRHVSSYDGCMESTACTDVKQRYVRIYAHCVNNQRSEYNRGSVVMSFINLKKNSVRLYMELLNNNTPLKADLFLLETGIPGNLTAQSILLNGKMLQLTDDQQIPELSPKRLRQNIFTKGIRIPHRSYGFIVLRNANAAACLENN